MLPRAGVFIGGFARGLGQRVVILASSANSNKHYSNNTSENVVVYSSGSILGLTVAKIVILLFFVGVAKYAQIKCCPKQTRIRNKLYFV